MRLISSSDAFEYIADGVRPNFRPITGVGVSCSASFSNCLTSASVQGFPVLRMYFGNFGNVRLLISGLKVPEYPNLIICLLRSRPREHNAFKGLRSWPTTKNKSNTFLPSPLTQISPLTKIERLLHLSLLVLFWLCLQWDYR
jgi:hypothetical protein